MMDDAEQMLCQAMVRAIYDLQVNQGKSADEISNNLRMDCQKFPNEELIEQVRNASEEVFISYPMVSFSVPRYGQRSRRSDL